jgi:hypothetical protein
MKLEDHPPKPYKSWLEVFGGLDPEVLLNEGTRVSEADYFEYVNNALGHPAVKGDYMRFEGSYCCVAYGYSPDHLTCKTSEDKLGQPLVGSKDWKHTVVISWNPYIRRYQEKYYDLLAYVQSKH